MSSVNDQSINDLRVRRFTHLYRPRVVHPWPLSRSLINRSLILGKTQISESVYKISSRTAVILDLGRFALQGTCTSVWIYY